MRQDWVVHETSPRLRVIVYADGTRVVLLAVVCALFAALGGWMMTVPGSDDPVMFQVLMGALSTLFFGGSTVFLVYTLVRGKPLLVIDSDGLYHNATLLVNAGFLAWSEIAGYRRYTISNQESLSVILRDPQAVISRASVWRRGLLRMSVRMSGTPVNIPRSILPLTIDELYAEISSFQPLS